MRRLKDRIGERVMKNICHGTEIEKLLIAENLEQT